jgi:hypothetical protein
MYITVLFNRSVLSAKLSPWMQPKASDGVYNKYQNMSYFPNAILFEFFISKKLNFVSVLLMLAI